MIINFVMVNRIEQFFFLYMITQFITYETQYSLFVVVGTDLLINEKQMANFMEMRLQQLALIAFLTA